MGTSHIPVLMLKTDNGNKSFDHNTTKKNMIRAKDKKDRLRSVTVSACGGLKNDPWTHYATVCLVSHHWSGRPLCSPASVNTFIVYSRNRLSQMASDEF